MLGWTPLDITVPGGGKFVSLWAGVKTAMYAHTGKASFTIVDKGDGVWWTCYEPLGKRWEVESFSTRAEAMRWCEGKVAPVAVNLSLGI